MSTPSPLDLTYLSNVTGWLIDQGVEWNTTEQNAVQDAITAFSVWVLRFSGMGPQDGGQPDIATGQSPFTSVVTYNDVYDGNGAQRLRLRNWPIQTVTSLTINTVAVVPSTSPIVLGYVITADRKFIALRGSYGTGAGGMLVNSFQNLWGRGGGYGGYGGGAGCGLGFNEGVQNVLVTYTAGFSVLPVDLQLCATRTVAKNYKQRAKIGLKSSSLGAGAGSESYDWDMLPEDWGTLLYYKRSASVP